MRFLVIPLWATATAVLSCKAAELSWDSSDSDVFLDDDIPESPTVTYDLESAAKVDSDAKRLALQSRYENGGGRRRGTRNDENDDTLSSSSPVSLRSYCWVSSDMGDDADSSSSCRSPWSSCNGQDCDSQLETGAVDIDYKKRDNEEPTENPLDTDTGHVAKGDLSSNKQEPSSASRPQGASSFYILLRRHPPTSSEGYSTDPDVPEAECDNTTPGGIRSLYREPGGERVVRKLVLCPPERSSVSLSSDSANERSSATRSDEADNEYLTQSSESPASPLEAPPVLSSGATPFPVPAPRKRLRTPPVKPPRANRPKPISTNGTADLPDQHGLGNNGAPEDSPDRSETGFAAVGESASIAAFSDASTQTDEADAIFTTSAPAALAVDFADASTQTDDDDAVLATSNPITRPSRRGNPLTPSPIRKPRPFRRVMLNS